MKPPTYTLDGRPLTGEEEMAYTSEAAARAAMRPDGTINRESLCARVASDTGATLVALVGQPRADELREWAVNNFPWVEVRQ